MKTPCVNGILRLVVGGAFVIAGGLKIAGPAKFALDVSNYRLVPHDMINLAAILLPWVEVTAGLLVLAGIWLRAAALVITTLTVMFFAVIVSALARGWNIECGCFGTLGGKHIGLVNLAIDSTLLCLAALLANRSRDRSEDSVSWEAPPRRSRTLPNFALRRSPPPPSRSACDTLSPQETYLIQTLKSKDSSNI